MLKFLEDPDHPSAGPYLSFMKLMGHWHPSMKQKSTRFKQVVYYVTIIFYLTHFKSLIDLDLSALYLMLNNTPLYISAANTIFFRRDYSKWKKIIEYMSRTERQQLTDKDDDVIDIMRGYIKRSRKVIYPFWILAFFVTVSFFTQPYGKNKVVENGTDIYVHLFNAYLPFNQNAPPGYYYSMALETFFDVIMTAYLIAWDSLVISTLIFFAGQLMISRVYCSKVIDPKSKTQSHKNIIKCQQFHTSLTEHQALFENLISSVMFIYLILASTNIAVCIVQISKMDDLPAMIGAIMYGIAMFVQLLVLFWFGNEVTVQSISVSSGAFESEWVSTDVKIQKEVSILQLATSKRLVFRAGPVNELSLNTFVAILKSSYSLFTLLKETN